MFVVKVLKEERFKARNLRKIRKDAKITLTDLAKDVGISKSYLSNIEKGTFTIGEDMMNTIECMLTRLIRKNDKKTILRKKKT